jgi:hypothetical protein
MHRRYGRSIASLVTCLAIAGIAACGGGDGTAPAAGPTITGSVSIKTLSNRPDMISDGDAYIEIVLPSGATASDLKVDVDGNDVSSLFAQRSSGRVLGIITGVKSGTSTVSATLKSVNKGARLAITNYDRGGPIFSGPQIQPWICATKAGSPATVVVPGTSLSATVSTKVSGLDADPVDAKCNAPTKFTYYYEPAAKVGTGCTLNATGANPCFVAYAPGSRPIDASVADFTNDRGVTSKAMLRLETGTMDRGEYQILSYFDPAQQGWAPWAPQKGWNGKLHWKFGASASGNRFQQNPSAGGVDVFDANALKAGFVVAAAQLTNHNDNNNEFLAAEQMMMVKEHIIDTYGEIRYTMSDGESGGSMMQTVIASVMPGLLQGIQPRASYPDAVSTWMETRECALYGQYYQTLAGSTLTAAQKAALEGKDSGYCLKWIGSFIDPQIPTRAANCGGGFPASIVYDPATRPTGVRCSIHDVLVNIFGTVIDTDRNVKPKMPYDNVGVQYGLQALRSGAITPDQFVSINESIGAYTADMAWTGGSPSAPVIPAPRFRALPDVFPQIYQSGLLDNAKNLAKVAIIDLRPELGSDIHQPWRSMQARSRLDVANGGHANQVIRAVTLPTYFGGAIMMQSFQMMDRWLTAIEADQSAASIEQKVIANRPADVRDGCYAAAAATTIADLGSELSLSDPSCPAATTLLAKSPRVVADGPLGEDIFKCQLKPLSATSADYGGAVFSAGQVTRLQAVFPDGVCDWTKPGVGQTSQWQPTSFANGPSGTVIPPPTEPTTF